MADDFDQLQPRHRVEEVQAEQPFGPLQRGAQILQRDARGVGGEDRARLHLWLEAGIDLLLQLQLFRHRLDDEIGVAHALAVHVGHKAVERVADFGRLADDLAEQFGGALDRAGDRLRLHVGECDAHPFIGAPGRDIAAHGAGADDMDMRDLVAAAGELLHLVAQEEDADQVLRRRRHHQARERAFLGCEHRGLVAAMLLPEIDQGVGRGIMFRGRGLRRLAAHAGSKQAARGAGIEEGVEKPRLRAFEPAEDCVLHGILHMPLLRDGIDQAQRLGAARIDIAAGEHQASSPEWD